MPLKSCSIHTVYVQYINIHTHTHVCMNVHTHIEEKLQRKLHNTHGNKLGHAQTHTHTNAMTECFVRIFPAYAERWLIESTNQGHPDHPTEVTPGHYHGN